MTGHEQPGITRPEVKRRRSLEVRTAIVTGIGDRLRKAGTRVGDRRKKRDVNATYSRSGSTVAICFQG
jgi:hypothetical protein